ncbi:zinc metallochaperone AztD [Microbacterium gorillae]|uniref:zinc metallochaperone AztD n=1 Tax=Microbacterium gorillae TaxID=1231063 RepID=UPI003D994579
MTRKKKMHNKHSTRVAVAALGATLLAALTACAGTASAESAPASSTPAAAETTDHADHAHTHAESGRVVVTYENGIAVLDPHTLEPLAEIPTEAFTRVNSFGDGRTVAVTTTEGFRFLDTAEGVLADPLVPATAAGHVVVHDGKTVLFDDGTGTTTVFDTGAFDAGYDALPASTSYTAPAAHHGVSIVLSDGTLLTTVGDESGRTGAVALAAKGDSWEEIAITDQCPGIHGEGTAQNEAVVFGCENGALVYSQGAFEKLTAPDAYGRMGNAFVSETSPIVVGDYKNDPDAEGYLLEAVTLIDTEKGEYRVVPLPDNVRYTFRDIARGPDDLAYILSTDGQIHVLDPENGEILRAFSVVAPWQGPAQWQDPHPAIKVDGDIAYVTEPATRAVHAVDLASGETIATTTLDHAPNELAVASD